MKTEFEQACQLPHEVIIVGFNDYPQSKFNGRVGVVLDAFYKTRRTGVYAGRRRDPPFYVVQLKGSDRQVALKHKNVDNMMAKSCVWDVGESRPARIRLGVQALLLVLRRKLSCNDSRRLPGSAHSVPRKQRTQAKDVAPPTA